MSKSRHGWGGMRTEERARGFKRTFRQQLQQQLQQHTDTSPHPLEKAAKRTRSARRPPSPSGPRPFTRRAAGPRPPLGSPEASLPAQMCSCLCRAGLRAAGLSSTCSGSTEGVAKFHQNRACTQTGEGKNIPFADSTGLLLFHHLIGLRSSICDDRMMWQPVFICNFVFTSIAG